MALPFMIEFLALADFVPVALAVGLLPFAGISCSPAGEFPILLPLSAISSSNLLLLISGRSNQGALPLDETLKSFGTIPDFGFFIAVNISRYSDTVNLY